MARCCGHAITPLRRRAILLAEAEAIEAHGARRREDPIRIATWRLEATGRADPALLLVAARLARYDHNFRRAADLARAALAAEPSAAAGLVLGEALYNLGEFEEAEQILADATELATGDDLIARIATVRRRNLFRGLRREAEAAAVGEQATGTRCLPAPPPTRCAPAKRRCLAISGRPHEALALAATIDASTPRLRVLATIPRADRVGDDRAARPRRSRSASKRSRSTSRSATTSASRRPGRISSTSSSRWRRPAVWRKPTPRAGSGSRSRLADGYRSA